MGMIVSVYRADTSGSDCTNSGMTNSCDGVDQLCLINVDGPFTPDERRPAARLEAGPLGSVRIVPACGKWLRWATGNRMFGGNFAYTSDSRFSAAVKEITGADCIGPVAIHDRYEA